MTTDCFHSLHYYLYTLSGLRNSRITLESRIELEFEKLQIQNGISFADNPTGIIQIKAKFGFGLDNEFFNLLQVIPLEKSRRAFYQQIVPTLLVKCTLLAEARQINLVPGFSGPPWQNPVTWAKPLPDSVAVLESLGEREANAEELGVLCYIQIAKPK